MASKPGSGGAASMQTEAIDRRERLRRLALETIDLSRDPYFMRNHLGQYECRLCLTLHNNEGNYLAHTQGKRHQQNLAKRAAREAAEKPVQAPTTAPCRCPQDCQDWAPRVPGDEAVRAGSHAAVPAFPSGSILKLKRMRSLATDSCRRTNRKRRPGIRSTCSCCLRPTPTRSSPSRCPTWRLIAPQSSSSRTGTQMPGSTPCSFPFKPKAQAPKEAGPPGPIGGLPMALQRGQGRQAAPGGPPAPGASPLRQGPRASLWGPPRGPHRAVWRTPTPAPAPPAGFNPQAGFPSSGHEANARLSLAVPGVPRGRCRKGFLGGPGGCKGPPGGYGHPVPGWPQDACRGNAARVPGGSWGPPGGMPPASQAAPLGRPGGLQQQPGPRLHATTLGCAPSTKLEAPKAPCYTQQGQSAAPLTPFFLGQFAAELCNWCSTSVAVLGLCALLPCCVPAAEPPMPAYRSYGTAARAVCLLAELLCLLQELCNCLQSHVTSAEAVVSAGELCYLLQCSTTAGL
eukprot:jgi/Botrbrau1/6094/Bobra.177_1s0032.1